MEWVTLLLLISLYYSTLLPPFSSFSDSPLVILLLTSPHLLSPLPLFTFLTSISLIFSLPSSVPPILPLFLHPLVSPLLRLVPFLSLLSVLTPPLSFPSSLSSLAFLVQAELDLKRLRDPLQLQLPVQQIVASKDWWEGTPASSPVSFFFLSFPLILSHSPTSHLWHYFRI